MININERKNYKQQQEDKYREQNEFRKQLMHHIKANTYTKDGIGRHTYSKEYVIKIERNITLEIYREIYYIGIVDRDKPASPAKEVRSCLYVSLYYLDTRRTIPVKDLDASSVLTKFGAYIKNLLKLPGAEINDYNYIYFSEEYHYLTKKDLDLFVYNVDKNLPAIIRKAKTLFPSRRGKKL